MSQSGDKFMTMHRAFSLQRQKLQGQIHKANETLEHKKKAVLKLERYQEAYEQEAKNKLLLAQFLQNNQHFLAHLGHILFTERQEVQRLSLIQADLSQRYHQFTLKMDGLEAIIAEKHNEARIVRDKIEDTIANELASTRGKYNA